MALQYDMLIFLFRNLLKSILHPVNVACLLDAKSLPLHFLEQKLLDWKYLNFCIPSFFSYVMCVCFRLLRNIRWKSANFGLQFQRLNTCLRYLTRNHKAFYLSLHDLTF
jgi:hypothetical protein